MLNELSNDTLMAKVKKLVDQEIVVQVIEYLKEIELRNLHLLRGYSSTFAFATEFLGYSEFEAHTRLQAARLTQAIPEVTEKILSGELNLSVAAAANAEFRREDLRRKNRGEILLTPEDKREILETVSHCSRREAEQKMTDYFGQQSDLKEYTFISSKDLQKKLDLLMDEHSHQNFDRDLGKLIELLVDKDLQRIEKKNGTKGMENNRGENAPPKNSKGKNRAYISIKTKREVWGRTERMCSYTDPITGKRCCGKHGLEIDHITPAKTKRAASAAPFPKPCLEPRNYFLQESRYLPPTSSS